MRDLAFCLRLLERAADCGRVLLCYDIFDGRSHLITRWYVFLSSAHGAQCAVADVCLGDFITVLKLPKDVGAALKDQGGVASNYQTTIAYMERIEEIYYHRIWKVMGGVTVKSVPSV